MRKQPKRGARIEQKFKKLKPKIASTKVRDDKKKKSRKKNYLATLIIAILLWIILSYFIWTTNPYDPGMLIVFFAIITPTLFFTFSILLINTRRGIIATILVVLFLIMRYFGVGNIINLLLLTALAITAEIYFSKTS